MDFALGMAAGTERLEAPAGPVIEQRLGDDAACRISGAQEQNVARSLRHRASFRNELLIVRSFPHAGIAGDFDRELSRPAAIPKPVYGYAVRLLYLPY